MSLIGAAPLPDSVHGRADDHVRCGRSRRAPEEVPARGARERL